MVVGLEYKLFISNRFRVELTTETSSEEIEETRQASSQCVKEKVR